jgi:hypothetical protein
MAKGEEPPNGPQTPLRKEGGLMAKEIANITAIAEEANPNLTSPPREL